MVIYVYAILNMNQFVLTTISSLGHCNVVVVPPHFLDFIICYCYLADPP